MITRIKLQVKNFIERLCQLSLQVFRIFPIKTNYILFSAFSGRQYSDSPKRLSDELLKSHPEYRQIWAFTEPEKYKFLEKQGIKVIKFKSLKYLYFAMTCNVFVDNVEFWSILKFRPEQMVLQTWHGGGAYKRVGSDRLDVGELEQKHAIEKMRKNTVFVSSGKAFSEHVIKGAFGYGGEILEVGLPRNDELINAAGADPVWLKEQLGIRADSKVVLYAPTYRKSLKQDLYDVDLNRLRNALHDRFGGEWTVVLRLHYYMSKQLFNAESDEFIVDATSYPDMQHLLWLSDVLLTDYSSTIWDFSLMRKPVFLYANDMAAYCTERNFYLPFEQWPFPKATDNESLAAQIVGFNEEEYNTAVAHHHQLLGNAETGRATQLVCERIEQHIGG